MAPGHSRVLSVLDARKDRLYACTFDTRGEEPAALSPEIDVRCEELSLEGVSVIVGEGAPLLLERARGALQPCIPRVASDHCPVEIMACLAEARFQRGLVLRPEDVGLAYLRPPDAIPPARLQKPDAEHNTNACEG
jgi:tRNA A37 threonylcarbamoyladenosine modification protein TsaB